MQMTDTIRQWLSGMAVFKDQWSLLNIFGPIGDRYSSQSHTSAGLAISSGGAATAKTGSTAWVGTANGIPVSVAASTTMPALSGSITATYFNVFCFFIDSASVATSAMGTEGATLAAVKFPAFPEGKALIGYLVVTYASTFVGGTTPLDTATTIYVNTVGAADPSVLVGATNF